MYKTMFTSAFLGLCFLSACSADGNDLTGPTADPARGQQATPPIVVMTRNMYVGADVDRVIAALSGLSPESPMDALNAAVTELYTTDLPTRLSAMADEILAQRPLVVALQEVSHYDIDLSALGAPHLSGDFLTGLQAALLLRGLHYDVVSNLNFNFTGIGGFPISLADSDVLLVDSRLEVLATSHGTYPCPLCVPVPNLGNLTRGWVRADVRLAGKTVTFVGTHPESGDQNPIPLLRAGQMQTLVAGLPATNPVILMGDFNGIPGSPVYQVLEAAGFVDAWKSRYPGDAGNTCCYATNLQSGTLAKRIDYVMVRGGFLDDQGRVVGGARLSLVGATSADMVTGPAGPIWPSDHAGIVASFPPAR